MISLDSCSIALIAACVVCKVQLDFTNTQSKTVTNKIILMALNNSLISDYAWCVLIGRTNYHFKKSALQSCVVENGEMVIIISSV